MRAIDRLRVFSAVAAVAVAVLPAAASAHPGIFTVTAKIVDPAFAGPDPATEANLIDQIQYAVGNDGYAGVWRESNGVTGHGLIQYKTMPSARGFRASISSADKLTYPPAQTNLQTHATCVTPALTNSSAILAWQGSDPFFNYVPFQKTTANLGDEPAVWIPVVQSATGVNLANLTTAAEFQSACEALPGPGVYRPADTVVTSGTSFASALIAAAVEPVQAQVTTLQADKTALQGQVDTVTAAKTAAEQAKAAADQAAAAATAAKVVADQKAAAAAAAQAAAEADAAAARSDAARLLLAAAPLRLTLGKLTPAAFAASGMPVLVTGPPLAPARVRALVSAAKAKALRLKSRVLACGDVDDRCRRHHDGDAQARRIGRSRAQEGQGPSSGHCRRPVGRPGRLDNREPDTLNIPDGRRAAAARRPSSMNQRPLTDMKIVSVCASCAMLATAALASPALAHVNVVSTSPAKGKTARTSVGSVSVTFSGPLRKGTLRVIGPGKRVVSIGAGGRDPRKVSRLLVELKSGLKAGTYTASWKLAAADGHKQDGSYTFKLKSTR